jgi:superfamily II DNA helicase RecQ
LFVSPERLASASFQRLFQDKWNKDTNSMQRPFPAVSLLCVDEAHCLSQWGMNFRPSYLRLPSLIHKIKPQSVLAMTATAGRQVVQDICSTLGIEHCHNTRDVEKGCCSKAECPCGVLTMKTDRENIDVKSFIVATQERRLSMVSHSVASWILVNLSFVFLN